MLRSHQTSPQTLPPSPLNITPQAEKKIFDAKENKEYLAIEGLDAFRKATVDLLLGASHPAIKEVRLNGSGGSGGK